MKLIIRYFFHAIREFPKNFCISMGLVVVLTVMNTLVPWGIRQYIDQVVQQNDYSTIVVGIVIFGIYLVGKVFVKIAWTVSLDYFGGKYIEFLSTSAERAMAETSYYEIDKKNPSIVRNILYTDIFNVFRVVGHMAPSMLGAVSVILTALAIAFVYEPSMTVLIFFATVVGITLSWGSRKILSKTAGKTNAKMKIHDAWCTQFVEMLPVIQSHNILPYYQKKTSQNLQEFIDTAVHEDRHTIFWQDFINGYHSLFSIALSALLAIPLAGNSVANLMFFTMISNLILEQAQTLETLFQQIIKNYVSFSHVDELLKLPKRQTGNIDHEFTSVTFDSVDFVYPSGTSGLQQISCAMQKGDFIQLSGSNGSGKSTFIKLLIGLYSPSSGGICFDNLPLQHYTQDNLNQQILYISQDEKCLNETFQDYLSILTGKSLNQEKFQKLLDSVRLPADGRTISGNGDSLSVGQRKKLLILKLLIKMEDASLIILDELTAGLDFATCQEFFDLVQRIADSGEKIILLVDHTCGEQLKFTRRFVFEDGKLTIVPSPQK